MSWIIEHHPCPYTGAPRQRTVAMWTCGICRTQAEMPGIAYPDGSSSQSPRGWEFVKTFDPSGGSLLLDGSPRSGPDKGRNVYGCYACPECQRRIRLQSHT